MRSFDLGYCQRILCPGDRGSEIVEVQVMLNYLGFQTMADGWYGNKTAESVMAFQKENLRDIITVGCVSIDKELFLKIGKKAGWL